MRIGDLVKVRHLESEELKECLAHHKKINTLDMLTIEDIKAIKAQSTTVQYGVIMGFSKKNNDLIEIFVQNEKKLINIKNILEVY